MCFHWCCTTISQSDVGIFQTCGKFSGLASPGLHCMCCFCTSIAARISIRLQEFNCTVESKTKDNVFVVISLTIQYQVKPNKVEEAYYRALHPIAVMENYILNSIRAKLPLYKLEALYVERGTISQQLKDEIDEVMDSYGIEIVSALISDINPGTQITTAMNDIQRLQRLRVAAVDEAETKKMRRVRAAEATCDAHRLAGEGLAEQRKAIVAGLMQSIEEAREDAGLSSEEATNMLLMNQYYDTMQEIALKSNSSVMIMETTGGLEKIAAQLKRGVTNMMK